MKKLYIIQYFKFKLGRNQLERFYISYLLPILEYGDVLWSGACDYELAKLDRVNIRAMRIERKFEPQRYFELNMMFIAFIV